MRKFYSAIFSVLLAAFLFACKDSFNTESINGVYKIRLSGEFLSISESPLKSSTITTDDILFLLVKTKEGDIYQAGVFSAMDDVEIELDETKQYEISAALYKNGLSEIDKSAISRWYPYEISEWLSKCQKKYELDAYFGKASTKDAKNDCITIDLYRKSYELVFLGELSNGCDSIRVNVLNGESVQIAQLYIYDGQKISQILHLENIELEKWKDEIKLIFNVYYHSGKTEIFERVLSVERNTQYNLSIKIAQENSYGIGVKIEEEKMDVVDLTFDLGKSFYCQYVPSSKKLPNGANSSMIYINRHIDDNHDVGMSFGNKEGTPNKNFDLCKIYILPRPVAGISKSYKSTDNGYISLIGHLTDNIQPIRFKVKENADGDFANESVCYFSSGFHGYKNATTASVSSTMTEISKTIYADGVQMNEGDAIYCNNIRMVVENHIQASNTMLSTGNGRNSMYQKITIDVIDEYANVQIDFIPLEDVEIYQMGGLSMYNDLDSVRFIGSETLTGVYSPYQLIRADKKVKTISQFNDLYAFDMTIDNRYGLGTLEYNAKTFNASIESVPKSYFHLLYANTTPFLFRKGELLSIKGSYRFHKR